MRAIIFLPHSTFLSPFSSIFRQPTWYFPASGSLPQPPTHLHIGPDSRHSVSVEASSGNSSLLKTLWRHSGIIWRHMVVDLDSILIPFCAVGNVTDVIQTAQITNRHVRG